MRGLALECVPVAHYTALAAAAAAARGLQMPSHSRARLGRECVLHAASRHVARMCGLP